MLHDPPSDKRPREVPVKYFGRIVRTRRNPASQTIILGLSQCSSRAHSDAAAAILRQPHFPVKSAETVIFATGPRLTGELPDVGTDGVFHRNLIRDDGEVLVQRRIAFKAPSLPYQSDVRTTLPGILAKGILEG
jgi:hypothetical protein